MKQNEYSSLSETQARFAQLGIESLFDDFEQWFVGGVFEPDPDADVRRDDVFWAIRSVLPKRVIDSYGRLPTVYRGFKLPEGVSHQDAKKHGFPISSRLMSWSNYALAKSYAAYYGGSVILAHRPQKSEVVLHLNQETIDFLHMPMEMVANQGEAVLSLNMLHIPPKMIVAYL